MVKEPKGPPGGHRHCRETTVPAMTLPLLPLDSEALGRALCSGPRELFCLVIALLPLERRTQMDLVSTKL